jgi:short-subunit dehydrogenase
MQIAGSVVLVTGANRGIGAEFVRQIRERGAARVYAGVRDLDSVTGTDGIERFAPVLAANGGGVILNVLSAVSWFSVPGTAAYSATKAAAWSLTDGLRLELAGHGTQVVGLHMGPVDTDMGAQVQSDLDKLSPAEVVNAAIKGIEAGVVEVIADDLTHELKGNLTSDPADRYAAFVV